MLVFENQVNEKALMGLNRNCKQHIIEIVDASPTSQFYCHITTEMPNVHVYLIEHNLLETYTICHCFSYDQFDEDYSYQNLSSIQVKMMNQFLQKANII
ncbi:hypothetical protein [Paenibacillus sp. FSL R7-0026]|uniref:hypothetical protein n=1 Tax=Paenibacillus sp. FSL R7-0026 TaxID=2921668 RepID=UPI0030FBF173